MTPKKSRVAIVYTHYPHYRQAVFEQLANSDVLDCEFFFSNSIYDASVKSGGGNEIVAHNVPGKRVGPVAFQLGLLRPLFLGRFDVVIFLGMPWFFPRGDIWPYFGCSRSNAFYCGRMAGHAKTRSSRE